MNHLCKKALTASIVIPTLNRGQVLCETLESIKAIAVAPLLEIIVVDQSTSHDPVIEDRLNALACEPLVRYHRVNFKGTTKARNYGVKIAKGDIIIFVDDDVYTSAGFIEGHMGAYQDPSVAGVAGCVIHQGERKLDRSDFSPAGLRQLESGRHVLFNVNFGYDASWARGCNMSFKREWIERIGGFDEGFFGVAVGEEPEFCHRLTGAGGRIRFVPHAELFHRAATSGGSRAQERQKERFVEFVENGIYFWWCVEPRALPRLLHTLATARATLLNSNVVQSGRWLSHCVWFAKACIAGAKRFRSRHPSRHAAGGT